MPMSTTLPPNSEPSLPVSSDKWVACYYLTERDIFAATFDGKTAFFVTEKAARAWLKDMEKR